jgi:hypothetical protein
MTNILVSGGAGYIGSHTCLDLANKGFIPVTYDSFSNGHAEFVQWGPMETGDIRDRSKLDDVIRKYRPVAIVHFAAAIEVGESVQNPAGFYDNNVSGTISLLLARRLPASIRPFFRRPAPCRYASGDGPWLGRFWRMADCLRQRERRCDGASSKAGVRECAWPDDPGGGPARRRAKPADRCR